VKRLIGHADAMQSLRESPVTALCLRSTLEGCGSLDSL
jgi:hypothetical protein